MGETAAGKRRWWRRPSAWPLGVKIALDLLVAALIPLVTGLWLSNLAGRGELERSSKENLQLLARVTASKLDQLLLDTSRTVQIMARDEAIVSLCADDASQPREGMTRPAASRPETLAAVQRQLQAVVESNPDFASIFVTDARGIGLAGTQASNVGMDFNFRDYFQQALAGHATISDLLVGKTTGEAGVYFAVPVRDPADRVKVIGVVALKLRGRLIDEMIAGVQIGLDGHAMLVDQHGVVIASPWTQWLFHSLGPLPRERITAIDPQTTYSQDTIEPAGAAELLRPMTDESTLGSALVHLEAPNRPQRAGGDRWVTGYARLQLKPWKVAVIEPLAQFREGTRELLGRHATIMLVMALAAGLLALWRSRSIVRPVSELTTAANKLAGGDFTARAPKHTDDEVGRLAEAFNAMVPQLQERVELQHSLAIAMQVQQALLPVGDPDPGDALDIAGRSRYCDATGGDYYDFIDVMPGREARTTLIAVGDVMGHGIGSALLMASARAALRATALEAAPSLATLLGRVNRVLADDARHNRFMTMMLLAIDPAAGTARWASAGHDPTIVYSPLSDSFRELEGSESPLGVMSQTEYVEYRGDGLKAGDVLLVGTDGIWEMVDSSGDMFGKERLKALMRLHHAKPAADISAAIEKALAEFRGLAQVKDDVTFVVVRITPQT